jgi:hypothetical protein
LGLSLPPSGFSGQPFNQSGQSTAASKPASGQIQPLAEQKRVQSLLAHYPGCACGAHDAQTLTFGDALQRMKSENYAHILGHEQAHASAAGSLGGGITIEYDGNGVAVAGHVPISIPGLNAQNPEGNLKDYATVRSAALAPGDPSGADMGIAARASALMGQAQVLMSNKQQAGKLGLSPQEFVKLGKPSTVDQLPPNLKSRLTSQPANPFVRES